MLDFDIVLTDIPGNMNKLAIILQNDNILHDTQMRPMNARTCVVGEAQ